MIKLSLGNGEKAILGDFFFRCIRLEMNSDHEGDEEYIFILQFVRTNKKHGPFRNPFSRETKGRGERLLLPVSELQIHCLHSDSQSYHWELV